MEEDPRTATKRKCSRTTDEIESDAKRKRLTVSSPVGILHLSDCTLLNVLRYLDATSLYQLSRTCTRFENIVQDESLWIDVDARRSPNDLDKYEFCWQNINAKTRSIKTAAGRRSQLAIPKDTFICLKGLQHLTVLALEHQTIKYCKLGHFPVTLRELSFRHSYIYQCADFFLFASRTMPYLRVLLMDHCQWVDASLLMPICKFPNLEIVSFYMCKKFGDEDISTLSLVGQMGFAKLKVLDVRFTAFGNQLLSSFHKKRKLYAVYFHCYPFAYRTERIQRKIDVLNGSKASDSAFLSDDEENNDTSMESLYKRYGGKSTLCYYNFNTVTDDGTRLLAHLQPNRKQTPEDDENRRRPHSFLYKYPQLDECTCGFTESSGTTHDPSSGDTDESEDDDDKPSPPARYYKDRTVRNLTRDKRKLKQALREQDKTIGYVYYLQPDRPGQFHAVSYDSCTLPNRYQAQSTPDAPYQAWVYVREPRNDHEISMVEHTDKHFRFCNQMRTLTNRTDFFRCHDKLCGGRSAENLRCCCDQDLRENGSDVEDDKFPSKFMTKVVLSLKSLKENGKNGGVYDILRLLDTYFFADDMQGLFTADGRYANQLRSVLIELAQVVSDGHNRVAKYHLQCFHDLWSQLRKEETVTAWKGNVLNFFRNMLHSERSNRDDNFRAATVHADDWNQPGPSGLQRKTPPPPPSNKRDRDEERPPGVDNDIWNLQRNFHSSVITIELRQENDEGRVRYVANGIEIIPQGRIIPNIPTNIKELSFRGYPLVTDRTLLYLRNLELNLLDVTGTNVTREGVREFLTYNPRCRVIHETACVCRPRLHF